MSSLESNCIITLDSRQISLGEEEDKVTLSVPGFFTWKNGEAFIYYSVFYDSEQTVPCKELVKLRKDGSIELIRQGYFNSKLSFIKGERTYSEYKTPAGSMMLSVTTQYISSQVSDKEIRIKITYDLTLDDDYTIKIYFTLLAKAMKG